MDVAVSVIDAYKRYTSKAVVLSGLNMTVKAKTIYGLLGPSGCGKTTLLNCIVGHKLLDYGEIQLSITQKSEVGYMPQEIALHLEMTISEIFYYYGKIYGMSPDAITNRMKQLGTFLELPEPQRFIADCSGGQQRRISMAVTLIHNPHLLILDEPTVGVDPLLCQRIWEYFISLAEEGKTIIITTHYIEEARHSTTIGLMRGGYLLAEDSPQHLMTLQNATNLEEVFLKLSKKQEVEQDHREEKPYPKKKGPSKSPLAKDETFKGGRMWAELNKNINWTLRNIMMTVFICSIPPINMVIIRSFDANNFISLMIAIVSNETCNDKYPMNISSIGCSSDYHASCAFLHLLHKKLDTVMLSTMEEAEDAVKDGRANAILRFPDNFTYHLIERIHRQSKTTEESIDGSQIEVRPDMSNYVISIHVIRYLYDTMMEFMSVVGESCGYYKKLTTLPMAEYVYGSPDDIQIISYVPAFTCIIPFFLAYIYTSAAMTMEKSFGLTDRTRIAGLTTMEVIGAHYIIMISLMTFVNIVSLCFLYGVYQLRMEGSYADLTLVLTVVSIHGSLFGLLSALILNNSTIVVYAGIGIVMTLVFLCGALWPAEGLHWLIAGSSKLVAIKYAISCNFDISLRGWSLFSVGVFPSFLIFVFATCTLVAICAFLIKYDYISL